MSNSGNTGNYRLATVGTGITKKPVLRRQLIVDKKRHKKDSTAVKPTSEEVARVEQLRETRPGGRDLLVYYFNENTRKLNEEPGELKERENRQWYWSNIRRFCELAFLNGDQGEVWVAAEMAYEAGLLIKEHDMKFKHEDNALRGEKANADLSAARETAGKRNINVEQKQAAIAEFRIAKESRTEKIEAAATRIGRKYGVDRATIYRWDRKP
jgi:hypothetical protein